MNDLTSIVDPDLSACAAIEPRGDAGEMEVTPLPTAATDRLPQDVHACGLPPLPAPACDPAPDSAPVSAERLTEAGRRQRLVELYRSLQASGRTRNQAVAEICRHVDGDCSRATLDRWDARFTAGGFPALLPETHRCGRKSAMAKLRESLGDVTVGELMRQARGLAHDTQSEVMALRMLAHSPIAPEPLAQLVDYAAHGGRRSSKHALPPSVRDELRRNPALALRHQGPRASALRGFWIPRKVDILPGDVWTSDDTTPIWGWWVPWPHALGNPAFPKASCEHRFGVKLLQGQLLPLMDVASNAIFSVALIARETSAYRASDIWAMFGRAFQLYGLPRLGFQLERGSWEANLIRGQKVETEVEGIPLERRVGGLRMLPTNVTDWHRQTHGADFAFPGTLQTWTSYLPKSKPVEAAFDRMQTLEGTLWGNLGRDQMRRPNERAKRQFEACRRGSADPREHFLSGTELMTRLKGLIEFLNSEPMEGEVFKGVPRLLWEQGLREHPLRHLPDAESYLFRRSWHVTKVTRGWVTARFTDAQGERALARYCNPEHFPALEGREVAAYFDSEAPDEPAQIHDAATGEFLCTAEGFGARGLFLDHSRDGHELKRRYNQALTTLYGDIAATAPSRQLPAEIKARREAAGGTPEDAAAAPRPEDGRTVAPARPAAIRSANAFAPVTQDDFASRIAKQRRRQAALAATDAD